MNDRIELPLNRKSLGCLNGICDTIILITNSNSKTIQTHFNRLEGAYFYASADSSTCAIFITPTLITAYNSGKGTYIHINNFNKPMDAVFILRSNIYPCL